MTYWAEVGMFWCEIGKNRKLLSTDSTWRDSIQHHGSTQSQSLSGEGVAVNCEAAIWRAVSSSSASGGGVERREEVSERAAGSSSSSE